MIQTKEPLPQRVSFFATCRFNQIDGADICDEIWDWGIFLSCPDKGDVADLDDAYDKFCLILCLNLTCKKFVPDFYTPCNVCEFIEAHRKTFDAFLEEENREGFRPSDYPKPLNSNQDEGYYEVYMLSMENLIAGNYADSDYEKLVNMLLAEE